MAASPDIILTVFLVLKFIQHLVARGLARLNQNYYLNPENQARAKQTLNLSAGDFDKTLSYTRDKFNFAGFKSWFSISVTLAFIGFGGLGWIEKLAVAGATQSVARGLLFFAILGLLNFVVALPFEIYFIFHIEQKHGFNRQTPRTYIVDKIKGLLLAILLGAPLLASLLWVMGKMGSYWWIWAWMLVSGFSLFTLWIYPSVLAPLFNKFAPLPEGDLKTKIIALSEQVKFRTQGLFTMDASKRSAHGNAYFTGVFGEKRIVLFDTLIQNLSTNQIVAVLAHELGHFKLHHVRWGIFRSVALTGLLFFVLSFLMPMENFYHAFGLQGVSAYGAWVVFGLWFGLLDFLLSPLENAISRRNEFAADRFAKLHMGSGEELAQGLLKLREKSHVMPLTHPVFSLFYYSHPPIMERIHELHQRSEAFLGTRT